MKLLSNDLPASAAEAAVHIHSVSDPTMRDLVIMMYLEAAGCDAYEALASTTPDPAIEDILRSMAREELGHARRISDLIALIYKKRFEVPASDANPYVGTFADRVDARVLQSRVEAEAKGATLYERWASCLKGEAASLLLEIARQERGHSERASEALKIFNR